MCRNVAITIKLSMESGTISTIRSAIQGRMLKAFATVLGIHLSLIPLVLNFWNPSVILKRGIVGSFWYGFKTSFLLYILDLICLIYVYKSFIVQPFRRYTLWEKCCECYHLKHILMWLSIPATYGMLCLLTSYSRSQPGDSKIHLSIELVIDTVIFHSIYYLFMWNNYKYDMTPRLESEKKKYRFRQCCADSCCISCISILFIILCTQTRIGYSISTLLHIVVQIPYSRLLVVLFLLSLIRSVSETILKSALLSDIDLSSISTSTNLLSIQSILKDLSISLSKGISIHSGTDSRRVNEEDSLYLVEPMLKDLHIMEKTEWMNGWKASYAKIQRQYQTLSEIVEQNQFVTIQRPVFSNLDILQCHLQWRLLLRLLYACDSQTLNQFVYANPQSTMVPLNEAVSTLIINTTLQLQIATRRARNDPTLSSFECARICSSDLRRTVYAVQTIGILIRNTGSINLFFEDTIFLWTLFLLSLHNALSIFEKVVGIDIHGFQTVTSDMNALFSAMDDVLYHIFNNKKLNLDHFTLPGEYYGIASRYLES
ncbi:hypothetical protein WA171_006302, partial [Blastocystis sp. BT1]